MTRLNTPQGTFILDHPHFQTTKVVEIYEKNENDQPANQFWREYLKPNHEITITVQIQQIEPFLKDWGNLQNQLTFDTLQFHLHHVDQVNSSKTMHYSPNLNLYHISHVIDGQVIKNDRKLSLTVKHVIRSYNLNLYQHYFSNSPITVVAQSNYGRVIGSAEIKLEQIGQDTSKPIKDQFICLIFRNNRIQHQLLIKQTGSFYAKTTVSVSITPIAPETVQLNNKMQRLQQEKANSPKKSLSPNRIISKSPNQRSTSPKVKRSLLKTITNPSLSFVQLSIYQKWEYKHKLQNVNMSTSKELIYRNTQNVKSKKIELIKQKDQYFLKFYVVMETPAKPCTIRFVFGSVEYELKILKNTLFRNLKHQEYSVLVKNDNKPLQNTIISFGNGIYIYARQNIKVNCNAAKLQIQCFMLNSLFIKSSLPNCQVFCNPPFVLNQVVRKQNGLMISYYYDRQIKNQEQTKIVFFLMSSRSNVKQIHLFDCIINQLQINSETLYRELAVKQQFARLPLKTITNQNYVYQIRAVSEFIRVVNGTNFCFQKNTNEFLILQIINLPYELLAKLIFLDNKGRSFCMNLLLYVPTN